MKPPSPYDGSIYVYRVLLSGDVRATADVANFVTDEAALAYGRALSRSRGGAKIEVWRDHLLIDTLSEA